MEVYMLQVSTDHVLSSRRQLFLNGVSSFVGLLAAIPLSLAIFSFTQPASAKPTAQTSDKDSYALYEKAFSQGYAANNSHGNEVAQNNPKPSTDEKDCDKKGSSHGGSTHQQSGGYKAPTKMSSAEWKATVTNAYNTYSTNNVSYVKNVDSYNTTNSNNTSTSSVAVNGSKGVIVSSTSTINGDSSTKIDVKNEDSNNDITTNVKTDVKIEGSFNDSHDKTKTETTNNTTTTTNTDNSTTIKDSFNDTKTTTEGGDDHQGPKPHDQEPHKA